MVHPSVNIVYCTIYDDKIRYTYCGSASCRRASDIWRIVSLMPPGPSGPHAKPRRFEVWTCIGLSARFENCIGLSAYFKIALDCLLALKLHWIVWFLWNCIGLSACFKLALDCVHVFKNLIWLHSYKQQVHPSPLEQIL